MKPFNRYKYSAIILIILFSIFSISCSKVSTETTVTAETTKITTTVPDNMFKTYKAPTNTEVPLEQKVKSYLKAMEKYNLMSVDEYETLPRNERLLYSQFLIDQNNSNGNYSHAYGKDGVGQDFAVEYTPVSIDNSGQEILDNNLYASQISYLQVERGGNGQQYDVSDGQKCLSYVYYNADNSSIGYIADKKVQETLTVSVCLNNKTEIIIDTSNLLEDIDTDGNKILLKIIKTENTDGVTSNNSFIYQEFTSYDGTPQAVWLLEKRISAS